MSVTYVIWSVLALAALLLVGLAHRILQRQRFLLPDIGEVLAEHWQAPPGTKVERVEWELGGQYLPTGDSTGSILCRDGEDFHVFRSSSLRIRISSIMRNRISLGACVNVFMLLLLS